MGDARSGHDVDASRSGGGTDDTDDLDDEGDDVMDDPDNGAERDEEHGHGGTPHFNPLDPLALGEYIKSQREQARMSIRRLSELANVSNPYLSQIERGLRRPSADVLQQVADALRVSVESLYVKAGILPDIERVASTVPEAIDADPHLSPEQKLALRNVYDSFVALADASDEW